MGARSLWPRFLPVEEVVRGKELLPRALPVVEDHPWKTLDETDGDCLDSHWHALAMVLLIDSIAFHLRYRNNYYVGGNQFVYYRVPRTGKKKCRGPDFYFVDGVSRTPMRRYWAVWQEGGRFPDVIIELNSPRSIKQDLTTKKNVYQRVFRTPEYVCYDPDTKTLRGWRLMGRRYEAIQPDERGWLWLERLQLWVGMWVGEYKGYHDTWLRFYDGAGKLVLTKEESMEAEVARLNTRISRAKPKGNRNGK